MVSLAGAILLILPGIYLSIVYGFAEYSVVLENMEILNALKTSRQIIKQYFWEVVLIGVLMCAVLIGGMYAVKGIISHWSPVLVAQHSSQARAIFMILIVCLSPIGMIFSGMFYFDLKELCHSAAGQAGRKPVKGIFQDDFEEQFVKPMAFAGLVCYVILFYVISSRIPPSLAAARLLPFKMHIDPSAVESQLQDRSILKSNK